MLKEKTRVHSMRNSPEPWNNLRLRPNKRMIPGTQSSIYPMKLCNLVEAYQGKKVKVSQTNK
jgi:hypothetical protein